MNDTYQDRAHRKDDIYSLKSGLHRYAQLTGAHENSFKKWCEGHTNKRTFFWCRLPTVISEEPLWPSLISSHCYTSTQCSEDCREACWVWDTLPFTPHIGFDLGPSERSVHAGFSCCLSLLGCAFKDMPSCSSTNQEPPSGTKRLHSTEGASGTPRTAPDTGFALKGHIRLSARRNVCFRETLRGFPFSGLHTGKRNIITVFFFFLLKIPEIYFPPN